MAILVSLLCYYAIYVSVKPCRHGKVDKLEWPFPLLKPESHLWSELHLPSHACHACYQVLAAPCNDVFQVDLPVPVLVQQLTWTAAEWNRQRHKWTRKVIEKLRKITTKPSTSSSALRLFWALQSKCTGRKTHCHKIMSDTRAKDVGMGLAAGIAATLTAGALLKHFVGNKSKCGTTAAAADDSTPSRKEADSGHKRQPDGSLQARMSRVAHARRPAALRSMLQLRDVEDLVWMACCTCETFVLVPMICDLSGQLHCDAGENCSPRMFVRMWLMRVSQGAHLAQMLSRSCVCSWRPRMEW